MIMNSTEARRQSFVYSVHSIQVNKIHVLLALNHCLVLTTKSHVPCKRQKRYDYVIDFGHVINIQSKLVHWMGPHHQQTLTTMIPNLTNSTSLA